MAKVKGKKNPWGRVMDSYDQYGQNKFGSHGGGEGGDQASWFGDKFGYNPQNQSQMMPFTFKDEDEKEYARRVKAVDAKKYADMYAKQEDSINNPGTQTNMFTPNYSFIGKEKYLKDQKLLEKAFKARKEQVLTARATPGMAATRFS
jgi:hypothetical protein